MIYMIKFLMIKTFIFTVDFLKKVWSNLVSKYRAAYNAYKSSTRSGNGYPENINWTLIRELSFLHNHVINRPVQTNLAPSCFDLQAQGKSEAIGRSLKILQEK